MDSSRFWIAGLAVLAGCTYDASKLEAPATKALDGAVDYQPSGNDGPTSGVDGGTSGVDDVTGGLDGVTGGADAGGQADTGIGTDVPTTPDSKQPTDLALPLDSRPDLGADVPAVVTGDAQMLPDSSPETADATLGRDSRDAVCTPPAAPGTFTATPGDGQVTLTWAASSGATSYSVSRKIGAGGTYAVIASPTVTIYTDYALTNGTTYYYIVTASNGTCSSASSTEASATPVASCSEAAPGSVSASPSGSVQVTITWTAASPVPTTYGIGRSTSSGNGYTSIGSVSGSTLTYTDSDTSLVNGTTYYYQVTANGSCAATSAAASATTACSAPAAPSAGLTAAANADGSITISWSAISGATAYTVYRSTGSDGTYTAISTNQTAAMNNDPASGLTNGSTYYYKVSASNANHQCVSAQSSAVSATSNAFCTPPVAPTGLSAKRSGNKQVTLAWTNSTGATLYNVLRSTRSGSGYASVGTSSGSPYVDNTAANGTAYHYVVTAASDAGGNCSSSNSVQVSVPACTVVTGGGSQQKQNDTSEWCIVSCDDFQWWSDSGRGDRTLYINTVQTSTSGVMPLPAKGSSGYAFYFTAGSGNYAYWMYGSSANHTCP